MSYGLFPSPKNDIGYVKRKSYPRKAQKPDPRARIGPDDVYHYSFEIVELFNEDLIFRLPGPKPKNAPA